MGEGPPASPEITSQAVAAGRPPRLLPALPLASATGWVNTDLDFQMMREDGETRRSLTYGS